MVLNVNNDDQNTLKSKQLGARHSLWQAHVAAFKGFSVALSQERNLKIHLVVASVVCVLALLLQLALWEWSVLLLLIGIVISTELLNTAIETVVDLVVGDEWVLLAGQAKDIAAAAVVVTVVIAVIVGSLIFGSHIVNR